MIRGTSLAFSALIIGAMVAGFSSPAIAADTGSAGESTAVAIYQRVANSTDPHAAYNSLSSAEKATFASYFFPADTQTSVSLTSTSGKVTKYSSVSAAQQAVAAASTCWGAKTRYTAHGASGNAIYDVNIDGTWCGNGSTVTSATFGHTWSTIALPGWRDGGQFSKGAGVVSSQARIYGGRTMILGAGGWDIQTSKDCVRLQGSRTGSYTTGTVCSLY